MSSVKIVSSEQMRRIEARSEEAGVSTDTLMERAGEEIARRVSDLLDPGGNVAVLVGPGNNGGDGLVAARHLSLIGHDVSAYLCTQRPAADPQLDLAADAGVRIAKASEDGERTELDRLLDSAQVVVDSVLGTGRSRPIEGALGATLHRLADARARRPELRLVAVDVPTGLDADTGTVDPLCPAANITVALAYPKTGLLSFPGADHVGALEIADIGLPNGVADDIDVELMTAAWASGLLPDRPSAAHKGTFGRTLIVAGSTNYVGAAYLAAMGAYRAGAGLVTLAVPESLRTPLAAAAPEPTYLPLPESRPGVVSKDAAPLVLDSLARYDALLIGCGLGRAPETRGLVEAVLYSERPLPPTIVDADGLNVLSLITSEDAPWWKLFRAPAVLTPHHGEMARLLGSSESQDRVGAARESAALWGKVTVLKGAHTVVASPGAGVMVSPFANPGMATAGTGDVLAGVIAGLLSQGLSLEHAAALGVFLHGLAGERVRRELGDSGMMASDLLPELPRVTRALKGR